MKKFAAAILAILYLGTSFGATMNIHYCMGKLEGWDFAKTKSKSCAKCGMEKKDKNNNGCCRDEHKFFKNNIDQKTTDGSASLLQLFATSLPIRTLSFAIYPNLFLATTAPFGHAPPDYHEADVYIRNCVFRI